MKRLLVKKMGLSLGLSIGALLVSSQSFAQLDLILTEGISGGVPIAVTPFAKAPKSQEDLATIIAADLKNSGRFNVLSMGDVEQLPKDAKMMDQGYWRMQGIDDLVVGHATQVGKDKYRVAFNLLDIYGDAQSQVEPFKSLIKQSYTVDRAGLRHLAHHLSDKIYQRLIGVPGSFSTRIAYVLVKDEGKKTAKYFLEVADADGFNPQPLVISNEPLMSPAWSPDGKEIAYVSFENHRATIFIQEVATGKRRVIANYAGINGAPAWSHDGKTLALVLSKNGYPKVYTLDVKSGQLKQVTQGFSIDTEPDWAPDDHSLVFTSNRGGSPQIYRVNLDDQHIERVTYEGDYNASGSFSADGQHIAMLHREDGVFSIAVQDLKTGRVDLLTRSNLDESPSIAPNGSMVLYATRFKGQQVLAMVSTDGNVRLRLPSSKGQVREPAWSSS